jgi:hypothetical protein
VIHVRKSDGHRLSCRELERPNSSWFSVFPTAQYRALPDGGSKTLGAGTFPDRFKEITLLPTGPAVESTFWVVRRASAAFRAVRASKGERTVAAVRDVWGHHAGVASELFQRSSLWKSKNARS